MPTIQQFTGVFHLPSLRGEVIKSAKPVFSFDSYRSNKYQDEAETYLSENFGFKEWAIRLYNQYAWSLFGIYHNSTIKIGRDNWIYNEELVRDHYESLMYKYASTKEELQQRLDVEALRLYKLQEVLKEYGVNLFVCMTPAKDIIFPEYLPENDGSYREEGLHAYDYYANKFKELGINNIDLCALFQEMKGNVDYPLYPKSGSHWSDIAVAHITDTLIRYMENLGSKNLLNVKVGPTYQARTRDLDSDLENVMNLIFRIESSKDYYADVTVVPDSSAYRPRMLSMGDSYCQPLNYIWPRNQLFETYHYWYYNQYISYDTLYSEVSEVDTLDEILNVDYLMIIWCPINIYRLGRDFVGKALINLCVDDERFQSVFNEWAVLLENKESEMQRIKNSSAARGVTENSVFRETIYNAFNGTPEIYFHELKGDGVPQSRNSRIALIRGDSLTLSDTNYQRKKIRQKIQRELWQLRYLKADAEKRRISDEQAIAEQISAEIENPNLNNRESQVQAIVKAIYADPDWLKKVKKKARKKGITVEEAAIADAEWMYDSNHGKE